jgi:hypothetical protein
MIKIQGQYTLEDVKNAQKLHQGPGGSNKIAGFLLLALAVLMALFSIPSMIQMRPLAWTGFLVPIILIAGLGLYLLFWGPRQIARMFQQQKDLSAPLEIDLSEDGFGYTNQYGTGRIPWKDFAKWKEDREMFLFYRSDPMFNMLPKRFLAGEDQVRYIRDLLVQNNVPDARKIRRGRWAWRVLIYVLLFIAIAAMAYFNVRQGP